MALNFNDYTMPDHAFRMLCVFRTAVDIGNEFHVPSLRQVETDGTTAEDLSFKSERTIPNAEICAVSENITELQTARETLQIINRMYDLYKEHSDILQEKNKIWFEKSTASTAEILSLDILSEKVQQVNLVLMHIKKIAMEVKKLKCILRNNVVEDFLNIHADFHRHVVHFFHLAVEITKDLEDDIACIEKCNTYESQASKNVELLNMMWKTVAKLDKSMDIVTEYRHNL